MNRIALVEDDKYLQEEIGHILTRAGYEVSAVKDFKNTMRFLTTCNPDLIILDINLPYTSGFEITKNLKDKFQIPILILTSRDSLQDELQALNLGADDYLTKPCHRERLLARVKNLLKRNAAELYNGGNFLYDPNSYAVYLNDTITHLPPSEGKILTLLFQKYPGIVSKEDISYALWNTTVFIDENTLQVTLVRLRKDLRKIGLNDLIVNVRGKGYCLRKDSVCG